MTCSECGDVCFCQPLDLSTRRSLQFGEPAPTVNPTPLFGWDLDADDPTSPSAIADWPVVEPVAESGSESLWRPWEQSLPAPPSPIAFDSIVDDVPSTNGPEWRELGAVASGELQWLPAPGTGPLERTVEQQGGALDVEPSVSVVSSDRGPEVLGLDGQVIQRTTSVRFNHNLHQVTDIMGAARSIDTAFGRIRSNSCRC